MAKKIKYTKKYRQAGDLRDFIIDKHPAYRYGEEVEGYTFKELQRMVKKMKNGEYNPKQRF